MWAQIAFQDLGCCLTSGQALGSSDSTLTTHLLITKLTSTYHVFTAHTRPDGGEVKTI